MTDGEAETNHLGQPIGFAVPGWKPPAEPSHVPMPGRFCRVEPLNVDAHAASLHAANVLDVEGQMWTYLSVGPFATLDSFRFWMETAARSRDPLFYAIVEAETDRAVGAASYLRRDGPNGSIEVGYLMFSPLLQRTPAATEAMYLMMKQVFALGYRRYEWKCNALNAPSRQAAQRLGFSFEGVFRQAAVVKGRNRDTAWYSVTDAEWPALQAAFQCWLDPTNFDANGRQRLRLTALTAPLLQQRG